MPRNATWSNPDGLIVGFGPHSIDNNIPRDVAGPGSLKTVQWIISLTTLDPFGTVTAAAVAPQGIVIPRGSRFKDVTVVANVACTGATAVLNIGGYKNDGQPAGAMTVDVATGLISCTVASIATVGLATSATAGTYISTPILTGTVCDADIVLVAQAATANFTAGEVTVTASYYEPMYNSSIAAPAFT